MAKPVQLDSFAWPTQSAALDAFRAILRSSGYGVGDRITDPVHDLMLREVLERHPDVDEKVGAGVDYFFIGRTQDASGAFVGRDAIGIWIHRVDGTTIDFSYQTAAKGRSARSDAKEAMRIAVRDTRLAYRDGQYASGTPVTSDISGAVIADKEDAHVVYLAPEWGQLTYQFARSEGGWAAVKVTAGGGTSAQVGGAFADPVMEARWVAFHARHATTALATASENARRPRADETSWVP
jgi:hypothetical protein